MGLKKDEELEEAEGDEEDYTAISSFSPLEMIDKGIDNQVKTDELGE